MVNLSEDYEELSAENARLKRMLASQRLPKSAKVGSIAQAALQANGYFEAVQRSADEYLREIKHLRDELAIRTQDAYNRTPEGAQAQAQAQALIKDAQSRADQIVSRAQHQARSILADARTRSDEALTDANQIARSIRTEEALRREYPRTHDDYRAPEENRRDPTRRAAHRRPDAHERPVNEGGIR